MELNNIYINDHNNIINLGLIIFIIIYQNTDLLNLPNNIKNILSHPMLLVFDIYIIFKNEF